MDSSIIKSNLIICVLSQLPKGCTLWIGDYIYSAFEDGWLLKLNDFFVKKEDGWYYFDLSMDCINYLENQLLESPLLINYFCHYGIFHPEQKLLQVLDGCHFVIDPGFNIPEWLVQDSIKHEIDIFREEVTQIGL